MVNTIKDVARKAGVGVATVSRVLNRSGYVKEETRRRVMEAVEALDYSPNMLARNLSRSTSGVIAVVIPDITNPFFSEAIRGISASLEPREYTLVFYNTNEDSSMELNALRSLLSHSVAGLIIAPEKEDNPEALASLRHLQQNGVPVVLFDRDLQGFDGDRIFIDNTGGAYSAVELLLRQGHRDIAVIHGPDSSSPGHQRLLGWETALKRHGVEPRAELRFPGSFSFEGGREQTDRILAERPEVTAIFSCNNLMTLGCLKSLLEHGKSIPEDMALIGFDQISPVLGAPITHIARPTAEMGGAAVEKLLLRIDEKRKKREAAAFDTLVMDVQPVVLGSEWMPKR